VPVDGFFEWKATRARVRSSPWIRTFTIITTDASELVADIHDRMPVIVPP
jgi:putative SOS response-associated peptidase YedK